MKLEKAIDTIPSNGEWWQTGVRKTFLFAAKKMIAAGISQDETIDILSELWAATASEFGN